MNIFGRMTAVLEQFRGLKVQLAELQTQVAELQARMSVVDGRSSLNAERNVRTHSSVQNLAEDSQSLTRQVRVLMSERNDTETESEAE